LITVISVGGDGSISGIYKLNVRHDLTYSKVSERLARYNVG